MKAKRNVHSYKIADKYYNRAARKAKKLGTTISEVIETYLTWWGEPPASADASECIPLPHDYVGINRISVLHTDGLTSLDPVPQSKKTKK
jgi:hypothetical protein